MKEKIKTWFLPWVSLGLNVVTALFWVALRINHSGISKFLGADHNPSFLVMNLPVMVCVLTWLSAVLALVGLLVWKKNKWPAVTALVLGLVFTGAAAAVIAFGAKDYLRFILVHFRRSLAVAGGISLYALVLFFPVTGKGKKLLSAKAVLLALVILGAVVIGYQLRPCRLTYGAVVYAVEDTYQIVFSTSDNAIAWVEIGGECYYDLYAGSMRSRDRVHKVEVPQSVLDQAGGYTVCAKQMIYRGPFGGYTGKRISQDYAFRGVDASDGLTYYAISDVHEAVEAAGQAAREPVDFLVLLGDLISMVETEADAQLANELAHLVTGGEIPVIYARGNHEIKGEYGEDLYKYVGSRDQAYHYWVTLGDAVYALVLDMGEDHPDDWWEYYGTARFELYQQDQTEMLQELLAEGDYLNYPYRMALCHIPIPYVDSNGYFADTRLEWTALLNDFGTDISLSGHKHVLWPLLPGAYEPGKTLVYNEAYAGTAGKEEGGYLLDARFPTFLVGRRSLVQAGGTQSDGSTDFTCLQVTVDLMTMEQKVHYVNSDGDTLTVYYPFIGLEEPFTVFRLPIE